MKQHHAFVFTPSSLHEFRPSMQRGDEETRNFAARSNLAMDLGGVSLAISGSVTPELLKEVRAIIDSFLPI